jgi:hypothetical protein
VSGIVFRALRDHAARQKPTNPLIETIISPERGFVWFIIP